MSKALSSPNITSSNDMQMYAVAIYIQLQWLHLQDSIILNKTTSLIIKTEPGSRGDIIRGWGIFHTCFGEVTRSRWTPFIMLLRANLSIPSFNTTFLGREGEVKKCNKLQVPLSRELESRMALKWHALTKKPGRWHSSYLSEYELFGITK